MLPIDKNTVNKILIIKLRGIGDVVLSTIVLENLKIDFPNAEIDYLTEKPSNLFLRESPFVNETIIFERKSTWKRFKQILEVKKQKYDLILDFYSNPTTAIYTYLSGARYRIGFPYRGRNYAYNIYGPAERNEYHAAQLHLEVLKNADLTHDKNKLYFNYDETDKLFIKNKLDDINLGNSLLVGISPSGGWASKKCDPDKFAEIADTVKEKYNCNILILWGPGDENDASEIQRLMKHEARLAPKTNITQMGALIAECDAFIGNDSGPMHIATAVDTPVLSLHGPTSPHLQGPFGDKHEWVRLNELECIECNLLECPYNHECFKDLPLERVMDRFEALLRKNKLIP